jgi:uncharacterized membrane-anchored protein
MGIRKALVAPWIDLFRGLGQSYLDLLAAEWAEIKRQLALSGKRLAWSAAFFGAAAAIGFWLVALVLFVLVAVLHVWLPWWGAALIVTAVALLAVAVLGWLGLRKIQRVENPAAVVGRRYEDHLDWWDRRLLAEGRRVPPVGAESREELL